MMNCFCGIVDWWKMFSYISNQDHCQRSLPLWIPDTPPTRFEPAQNLISGFIEWSCAVVITITAWRHIIFHHFSKFSSISLWKKINFPSSRHLAWASAKPQKILLLVVTGYKNPITMGKETFFATELNIQQKRMCRKTNHKFSSMTFVVSKKSSSSFISSWFLELKVA